MENDKIATILGPIKLEDSSTLQEVEIAYTTYGKLNLARNNVIWVCHALTANSRVDEWWPGMIGPGKLFDTNKYSVVCANVLGSCYGTTGPLSSLGGIVYYHSFPKFTIRDIVCLHQLLAQYLGIAEVELLIGGSLGGMQALEWAVSDPYFARQLVVIATNARTSAWSIAFNEAQRLAIEADQTWLTNHPDAGLAGLKAARASALLSYRNYKVYTGTQTDQDIDRIWPRLAAEYQQYQGNKLIKRFNAFSYYRLTQAMDSHNVGRNREGIPAALSKIQAETLVIGIKSDILFPTEEQRLLARLISDAQYIEFESHFGHDGFLTEIEKITVAVNNFRRKTTNNTKQVMESANADQFKILY
jgi:homoserine O-acetyltransferase